ncbi:MAG: PEP-CTERM sorting domain-containing protein [Armatimonadetes bacterium]|nr:PEP-CTERM sorting domain-containing protein [Armatimonadota bacterium]
MTTRVSLRILTLALATATAASSFGYIAFDSASDATYAVGQEYIQVGTPAGDQTNATNGKNGGYGWNKWQRGGYGDNGNFGNTLITNVNPSFNMGAQQFGVRSGAGGNDFSGADARRRLLNPLSTGNTMFWSMMAGGNGAGTGNTKGEFGAEIRSSLLGNPGRDMCSIIGEVGDQWRVYRNGGSVRSTLNVVAGQRVDVMMTIGAGDTFDVLFTAFGGGSSTVSGTFLSAGQQVQTVQFYAYGTDGDFYMNNIGAAVPEPSSLVALGGITLLMVRRRRTR